MGSRKEGRKEEREGEGIRIRIYLEVFSFPLGRHDTSRELLLVLLVRLPWTRWSAVSAVL